MIKNWGDRFNNEPYQPGEKSLGITYFPNFFVTKEESYMKNFDENKKAFIRNESGHNIQNNYLADSCLFAHAFSEIQKDPDSHFITPYNDLLREGYIPESVGVIVKETGRNFQEKLGSQLSNYFGIYTPVNIAVGGEDLFGEDLVAVSSKNPKLQEKIEKYRLRGDMKTYSVSIDFEQRGKKIIKMGKDGGRDVYFYDPAVAFEYAIPYFEKALSSSKLKHLTEEQKYEKFNGLKESLMRTLLFRLAVCDDGDFKNESLVLIVDNDDAKLLNYDFEFCFGTSHIERPAVTTSVVMYACRYYPKVMQEFYSDAMNLCCNLKTADSRTLRQTIGNPQFTKGLISNLEYLDQVYSRLNGYISNNGRK